MLGLSEMGMETQDRPQDKEQIPSAVQKKVRGPVLPKPHYQTRNLLL